MRRSALIVAGLAVFAGSTAAFAQSSPPSRSLLATPHNLAISGGGGEHDIHSTEESRVCIFCHTPHHAQAIAPLWSRDADVLTIYIPYSSPTLKAGTQQPQGASRVCLSCHDGTIALGLLAGGVNLDPALPAIPQHSDPARNASLGTDLSDDHPISIAFLPGMNPELNDPSTLPEAMKQAEADYLECTACHDPHNNQYGNFLVLDSSGQEDALCTTCHKKYGWELADSVHRTGGSRFPGVGAEVAQRGCRNCHRPHSAAGSPYLLEAAEEEANCLTACHQGFPFSDVASQFSATAYHHPVENYLGVHRANPTTGMEDVPVAAAEKHVECVDCHNPHQAGWQGSPLGSSTPSLPPATTAPQVSGALRGVRGVDKTGTQPVSEASAEYEICFKCHAGPSADQFIGFAGRPVRQFESFDQSQRFYIGNPSYHPVTEDRIGNGASLLSSYQVGTIRVYCVDCHSPHGSNEPHFLLLANQDAYPAAVPDYPLCFKCHDQQYLWDPLTIPSSSAADLHKTHVKGKDIPCSVCHDPHGVPASRGATAANAGHLINFDTRYAGATPSYDAFGRTCTVACHTNNPRTY
ncbi:c-type cytochrome [Desulfuromonas versatilis]|uniref:C-type cytochrome n=1 Tax=Desulfuromonas versatilis TaxID=2802975 RepID=A0ABN6DV46_9BACT|nr:cytochrome c3 family protein [Desulfuromonas versatilis]BCR03991.1 c-type cytochrome [Desulfuromonas versatilis]